MWRVALVPGPAAAGSRSDTRRHQVSGISCLLPCPLCEYSVGLQSHNPPRALATLFFIYLLCLGGNLYHRGATHLKMDQSAVSQVFLPHPPPNRFCFFRCASENCARYAHNTANPSRLRPLISSRYAPSITGGDPEGKSSPF